MRVLAEECDKLIYKCKIPKKEIAKLTGRQVSEVCTRLKTGKLTIDIVLAIFNLSHADAETIKKAFILEE